MVGVEWEGETGMSEMPRLWLAGTPVQVQRWTPCLGEAPHCPARARVPGGQGRSEARWSRGRKRRPPACGGPGKPEPAVARTCPAPVNSLAGLLGLSPSLRSAGGPPPTSLQRQPRAPSKRSGRAPLRLQLLVVPAPAVAARGPAPQEGLQLVHRRPRATSRPPPVLPAVLPVLALLVPALPLGGLFFLLGVQCGVTGHLHPHPPQHPGQVPLCLSFSSSSLSPWGEARPLYLRAGGRGERRVSSPTSGRSGANAAQSPHHSPWVSVLGLGGPPPVLATEVTCQRCWSLCVQAPQPQGKPGTVLSLHSRDQELLGHVLGDMASWDRAGFMWQRVGTGPPGATSAHQAWRPREFPLWRAGVHEGFQTAHSSATKSLLCGHPVRLLLPELGPCP